MTLTKMVYLCGLLTAAGKPCQRIVRDQWTACPAHAHVDDPDQLVLPGEDFAVTRPEKQQPGKEKR